MPKHYWWRDDSGASSAHDDALPDMASGVEPPTGDEGALLGQRILIIDCGASTIAPVRGAPELEKLP